MSDIADRVKKIVVEHLGVEAEKVTENEADPALRAALAARGRWTTLRLARKAIKKAKPGIRAAALALAEQAPATDYPVEEAPEATFKKVELEKGQKIDKVRVKEINYFDGCPILSMREDVVGTMALNYDQITCGMYVNATIDEVNSKDHYVVLKVNDFVKGRLYIEHMADLPLKVLPPKLT